MNGCHEVRRHFERFLALELPPKDEKKVRDHLTECDRCREALVDLEPAEVFAFGPPLPAAGEGEFVAGVMAGVRQRRVESAVQRRRGRWLGAAAAVAVLAFGGAVGIRLLRPTESTVPALATGVPAVGIEAPIIEVEGNDVRVYQLASADQGAVQVAFIVDPALEL